MSSELTLTGSSPENLAAEEGYPLPEAQTAEGLPPGGGKLVLPHFATFSQLVNLVSRSYRWTHDEALRDSKTNALAMRRDPVVMDALRSRQIPTVQLEWHLEPEDDTDSRQVEAADGLTKIIQDIPSFQTYKMLLMEAVWYGRYAVQNVFRWDYSTGKRRLIVDNYYPINGDKLVFRYSGQVGVLIHPTFFKGDSEFTDRGRAHFLTPEEREQLVIHKHEPEDADFYEPELAGGIHGVGIRGRIYWLWWLRSQITAFLMDYLERVGAGGLTFYYYEAGNPDSLTEVKKSAEEQWRNNAILFPRYRQDPNGGPGVLHIPPSPAGAQLLESLIVGYFDNVLRRYILGQSLTTEAQGTGMGSGVADLHADTFNRIVKFDAVALQETITKDLVKVLSKYNYPGVPAPKFAFDVDKPNAAAVLEAARQFYEMGGQIDEDELRSVLGLAAPQPGHAVLAKVPATSPMGVGALPQGVPMEGQPGPIPGAGGQAPPPGGGDEQPMLFRRNGELLRFNTYDQSLRSESSGFSHDGPVMSVKRGKDLSGVFGTKKTVRAGIDLASKAIVLGKHLRASFPQAETHSHGDTHVLMADPQGNVTGWLKSGTIWPGQHGKHEVLHKDDSALLGHERSLQLHGPGLHVKLTDDPNLRPILEAALHPDRHLIEGDEDAHLPLADLLEEAGHPHAQHIRSPHGGNNLLAQLLAQDAETGEFLFPPPGSKKLGSQGQPVRLAAGSNLTPDPSVLEQVKGYMTTTGRDYEHSPLPYHEVYPHVSKAVADYYHATPHKPNDPKVRSAYEAMKKETLAQFNYLREQGVEFEPWLKEGQPYRDSKEMREDVLKNRHLGFFIGGEFPDDHPLKEPAGVELAGHQLTYNDVFRAVHDYFGHALYGNQFGPRGEEHAWRTHSRMYSPEARPAMSFETRGQNSWVNFGPHMRHPDGRVRQPGDDGYIPPPDRPFAEQKANVLPDHLTNPAAPQKVQLAKKEPKVETGQPTPDPATVPQEPKQEPTLFPIDEEGYPRRRPKLTDEQALDIVLRPVERSALEKGLTKGLSERATTDFNKIKKHISDEELVYMKKGQVGEFLRLIRQLHEPEDKLNRRISQKSTGLQSFVEAAKAGKIKRGWYANARRMITTLFPHSDDAFRFTAILAATSPRVPVDANFKLALDVWHEWNEAGRPKIERTGWKSKKVVKKDKKTGKVISEKVHQIPTYEFFDNLEKKWKSQGKQVKVVGEDGKEKLVPWGSVPNFDAHLGNVIKAMNTDGEDWHKFILSGLKVNSFYQNLIGNLNRSTNDTWMAYFGGIKQAQFGKRLGYSAYNNVMRNAVHQLNQGLAPGEEPWQMAEVQETVWSFFRTLSKIQGLSRYAKKPVDSLTALKNITHGDINDTVDFMTEVVNNPHVHDRIRQLGLGRELREVHKIFKPLLDAQAQTAGERAVEGTNPILESISRVAGRHAGPFATGRMKKQARGPRLRYALSPHIRELAGEAGGDGAALTPATGGQEPSIQAAPSDPWTFYSPNVDEGLTFEQAYQRLRSPNQKAFRQISEDILQTAGVNDYKVYDAVGDWSDGAENSILHVLHNPPAPEVSRYLAAWHGLLGNQKAVLHFTAGEGQDSVYQVFIPESSANKVRASLDQAGVGYRTVVPAGHGHIVVVYDEGRQLRPNIETLASQYGASVREAPGRGEFIGGATRTAARAKYRDVIREFESGAGTGHRPAGARAAGPADASGPASPPALYQQSAKTSARRSVRLTPTIRRVVRLDARKAPEGGMAHRGVYYPGGSFIPEQPPVQASPAVPQQAPVAGQGAAPQPTPATVPVAPMAAPRARKPNTVVAPQPAQQPDPFEFIQPITGRPTPKPVGQAPEKKRQPDDPVTSQIRSSVLDEFQKSLGSQQGITDDHRRDYHGFASFVIGNMPAAAVKRFAAGSGKYTFFRDSEALTFRVVREYADAIRSVGLEPSSVSVGGLYNTSDGHIWLDGRNQGKTGAPAHHIYAHEFSHAIDGKNHELSQNPAWYKAWVNEIQPGSKLGKYATTDEAEGFAEFGRLLYSREWTPEDLGTVEKHFPRASAFWKDQGLWPE
jgi:hypothetical protein